VKSDELRRRLERIEVPDEHEARVRAWEVVRAAHAEREPATRPRRLVRPALVFAALAALVAGALSPPGRALIDSVREAIGVEEAAPILFELPAEGRVLVTSARGVWVVQPDGYKRLLGRYREASWSPFGRYVVAARANELVALEPDTGKLRWSLASPAVRLPRWGGSRTDTRIAYLSGSNLRVVGGNGRGDKAVADAVARVAPAWRPGARHVLAFAAQDGFVSVYATERLERYWRSRRPLSPVRLAWSDDGDRLLVVSRSSVLVIDTSRPRWRELFSRDLDGVALAAAFRPGTHRFAVVLRRGASGSEVAVYSGDRRTGPRRSLFRGTGRFDEVAWSPDGRWVLVAWRDADQWVLIRAAGARRLEAVASISQQFRSRAFPAVGGWSRAAAP
jgi:hypothetical protein